ncbi:hypothetical protein L861_14330 [Litchfieldella anticariensis FP35 = DSM 16096]|uniref:N-acetyltransferase domain-containing protein n=2 Tax=Litchfieldella anticariensis TaxID=258591 RepID=S2KE42_LITA3|nr:hypothetical protein L861_14330 [Halomonas anticariensis FP35 = DSM 16096]
MTESELDPNPQNEQTLLEGLHWESGDAEIRISYSNINQLIDLELFMSTSRSLPNASLTLCDRFDGKIGIVDLVGNHSGVPIHSQNYGTLLVNLAIQTIHFFYGLDTTSPEKHQVRIFGRISHNDAPTQEPGRTRDINMRINFWQRFGFRVDNPESIGPKIWATLDQLSQLDRGVTPAGIPTTLCLSNFSLIKP